jgi:hypothetical protein
MGNDDMDGTPPWRRGHLVWLQAAARTSAAERERCAAVVERWNANQRSVSLRPFGLRSPPPLPRPLLPRPAEVTGRQ